MARLILDTSTDQCIIALTQDGRIEIQEIFYHQNQLSETLMPRIQSLIDPKQITEIALGTGPGSYTGTRVGAAVAKCLAFGLNVPIKAFASPLAFLPSQIGPFAFVIPARSGQFYVLKGRILPDAVVQESAGMVDETDLPISELKAPNLPLLNLYLSKKEFSPLENIELQYLGSPIKIGSNSINIIQPSGSNVHA